MQSGASWTSSKDSGIIPESRSRMNLQSMLWKALPKYAAKFAVQGETIMVTLYEKAAAIAIKLQEIWSEAELRPEWILKKSSAKAIDFFYAKMIKGDGYTVKWWML